MVLTKQLALASLDTCMRISGDSEPMPDEIIKSEYTSAEASVFVDHDLKVIFVTAKGSKEFKDFIYDAKFHKDTIGFVHDKPIRVHCGFSEQELSIGIQLFNYMVDITREHSDYFIVCTGHSLGKSIIELFCFRRLFLKKNKMIITYGGACTGNELFVSELNRICEDNYGFFNEKDVIPKLLEDKFNYVHGGKRIELSDIKGFEGTPANIAAAIFNHDTKRDYYNPINRLSISLNDEIVI